MAQAIESPGTPSRQYSEADGWFARAGELPQVLYWSIHLSCLLAFWVHPNATDLWLLFATFTIRLFGITGGYHRYFSHKAYKTSRPFQFVLAVLGATATQKGPLWWAGHHRTHHKHSDQPGLDVHSPKDGFYHSHQSWIFNGQNEATDLERMEDFARYPELLWLNQWHVVGPLGLGLLCFAIGGGSGLLWGFAVSTVLLWHSTYSINSLAHRWGTRRYATRDTSRNNAFLALLTFGEGWHNNHHHYCASARQGFFWWEVDLTYYILRALAAVGLVWDLNEPPRHILESGASKDRNP